MRTFSLLVHMIQLNGKELENQQWEIMVLEFLMIMDENVFLDANTLVEWNNLEDEKNRQTRTFLRRTNKYHCFQHILANLNKTREDFVLTWNKHLVLMSHGLVFHRDFLLLLLRLMICHQKSIFFFSFE